jgi:kinesin family protein 4/21/27
MVAPKPPTANGASGNVRVVVRIRPLSSKEIERGCKESIVEMESEYGVESLEGGPEILQVQQAGKNWFEFDAVIGHRSAQKDVYVRSGAYRSVTEDIFKGYNVTFLAYGQTGAGKTFTMGTFSDADENAGILPRACQDLFDTIASKCDGNGKVELSYLEIYNEEVRDLLSDKIGKAAPQLKIRETLNGEVYVSGLSAKEVKSSQEIASFVEEASSRRVVASTAMNAVSSRSHAICSFKVSGVLEGGEKFTSKLTLVDLAGSERIKKTGAQGDRQLEGIMINKSLMTLGQVVSALGDGKKGRKPPYRDSKLTRLLQDSLGGNSRTIMVACVSPADYNVEESVNTLRYATSARAIKNTATRNLMQQISQEEALKLQRENQLLKQQVAELQENLLKLGQLNCEPGANEKPPGGSDDGQVKLLRKELSVAALEVSHAAIEVPALKMEIAQLKEVLVEKELVEKENEELRQELNFTKADANGARVAAQKLQEVMDHLKGLKQDEIRKKQILLKHKRKEKEWVDFVARILDRRTDQLKQLQNDFELVIKVVESPAIYMTEERRNWIGQKQRFQIQDPEMREQLLREHVSFFKEKMDEIQSDIFVRAISLQGIRDRIDGQCSRMEQEVNMVLEEADVIETKESDVLSKLVSMLIEPSGSRDLVGMSIQVDHSQN